MTISLKGAFDENPIMLPALRVLNKSVIIETDLRVYQLDLSNVDPGEIIARSKINPSPFP